jgi:hypothetical protein
MFVPEKNVVIQARNVIIIVVADDLLIGTGLQCVWLAAITTVIYVVIA